MGIDERFSCDRVFAHEDDDWKVKRNNLACKKWNKQDSQIFKKVNAEGYVAR